VYLTLATAVFNTVQDRYRLPADAFLVMFALHELRRFWRWLSADGALQALADP
jgi:hypothetical protein